MVRSFDDTTRRNIAELCAAFTRAPSGDEQPGLKRAAVAIALTEAEAGGGPGCLVSPAAPRPCVRTPHNGRYRAGVATRVRRRRRLRCANCTKSLASPWAMVMS